MAQDTTARKTREKLVTPADSGLVFNTSEFRNGLMADNQTNGSLLIRYGLAVEGRSRTITVPAGALWEMSDNPTYIGPIFCAFDGATVGDVMFTEVI